VGSTLLPNSLPPPHEWYRGTGNGSCCQAIACCHCHSFLLTLFTCSIMSSLPWETVLHELARRGRKSCQQTCSRMGSPLHGATGPARSLLQHRLPTGSQPPSGIHLLWLGVLSCPAQQVKGKVIFLILCAVLRDDNDQEAWLKTKLYSKWQWNYK